MILERLLEKRAKYDYTPNDWRKYTTGEERQAIQAAQRQILWPYYNPLRLAVGIAQAPLLGYMLAPLTPTWDAKDLKEYGKDENTHLKQMLIPGYWGYTQMKTLGGQRAIQSRVEESAKETKKKSEDK